VDEWFAMLLQLPRLCAHYTDSLCGATWGEVMAKGRERRLFNASGVVVRAEHSLVASGTLDSTD
jgi:hypothetical protein